jgi:signal transduction histidine kinase
MDDAGAVLRGVAALVVSCGVCESCTIYLQRSSGGIHWAARARREAVAAGGPPPSHEQVAEAVARGGREAWLDGDACLVLPLMRESQAFGAMALARGREQGAWGRRERDIADELAAQVATMLDTIVALNARIVAAAEIEMRSLLTAIQLRVQNMRRRSRPRPNEWHAEELEKVYVHVRRLALLMRGVQLAADAGDARVRDLPRDVATERCDLAAVARHTASEVQRYRNHGGTLDVDAPEPVWGRWNIPDLCVLLARLLDVAVRNGPGAHWRVRVHGPQVPWSGDAFVEVEADGARPPDDGNHVMLMRIARALGGALRIKQPTVDAVRYVLRLPAGG